MFDSAQLPEAPAINVRGEPDYYGASYLIAKDAGLRQPPKSKSSWVHGCDMFPIPRAVFSPQSTDQQQTHLVGNLTAQQWWRANGYSQAIAVGCPFIYTPPSDIRRIPGSVLAMPSHGLPGSKRDEEQTRQWFEEVARLKQIFSPVVVCLHADDVELLRPHLERHQLPWFSGANLHTLSLPRMRAVFDTFDIVVSDVQGSHFPYAAWSGCKIALLEPLFERKWEHFKDHVHYKKFPQLEQNIVFHQKSFIQERLPFLFTDDLTAAATPMQWAADLLGAASKRTPQEMARLLGWQWDANDPAFAGLAYEDVAAWLGAANEDPDKVKLIRQHQKLKEDHQSQGKVLRTAEKKLKQQQPYLMSFSGKAGRRLYSIEKRLRGLFGKGANQD